MKRILAHTVVIATLFSAAPHLARVAHARTAYSQDEIHAVENTDDSKIRELRSQEINELRIALGRRLPTNRRADLYFRLAEIYLEAYHAEFLLEGRVHEQRLNRGQDDPYIDR